MRGRLASSAGEAQIAAVRADDLCARAAEEVAFILAEEERLHAWVDSTMSAVGASLRQTQDALLDGKKACRVT